MSQQSSIEWLVEQLDLDIDSIWAIQEAKRIHKKEIIESHEDGGFLLVQQKKHQRAELYYKNTYEKE